MTCKTPRTTSVAAFPLALAVVSLAAGPAFAHHAMGGQTPASFADGLLSGLGHPVIGLDHFAAVVAVGCLAAAHSAGAALALGFVVMMMVGVALHVQGLSVPGAEMLVALTVIALAALNVTRLLVRGSAEPAGLRLLGAGVAGIGLAIFVQQVMPAA